MEVVLLAVRFRQDNVPENSDDAPHEKTSGGERAHVGETERKHSAPRNARTRATQFLHAREAVDGGESFGGTALAGATVGKGTCVWTPDSLK